MSTDQRSAAADEQRSQRDAWIAEQLAKAPAPTRDDIEAIRHFIITSKLRRLRQQ